jgi:hypothetical protein
LTWRIAATNFLLNGSVNGFLLSHSLVCRLAILPLLIVVLVATPAVCCGQIAAATAALPATTSDPGTDHCPGHARAVQTDAPVAAGAPGGIHADDCAGCALLAAIPSSEERGGTADDGPDVPWPAIDVAAVGFGPSSRASRPRLERAGRPTLVAATPVTRFDRILIPN